MKNILKKDYSIVVISIALLGLSGCVSAPESNHTPSPINKHTPSPVSNHIPTVTVPENQMIRTGESLTLKATVSDKDKENELTYFWRIAGKPKGSKVTLNEDDAKKTTISFKADKNGAYYFDFYASDGFANSKPKRVTITAFTIVGEWTADLTKTKEEFKPNESETAELVETLSSNYKFVFLEDGKVEGDDASSWTYTKEGNYQLNDSKEIKLINANELYMMGELKSGKEIKLYYKRALKK